MTPSPTALWRSWLLVGGLVGVLAAVAWRTGGPQRVGQALASGGTLFIGVLPNLLLGFALAGFLHVLVPSELISRWMGQEAGWPGLFIGTVAGTLTPGGPFTHFPILASFLAKGAGVGPVCAYIAAWGMLGLHRFLIWELPLLGAHLAGARWLASAGFPPLIGALAAWLFRVGRLTGR
jgi:uncharacterized membrane protein YraQ (UPF0718 family)